MMGRPVSRLPEIPGTMPVGSTDLLDRQTDSRHQDQLRLLFEVSEAVASHRDLTALFRDLARRLPAIVPFEVIALFLHDPDKGVMRTHMLGTADADQIPPGLEVPVAESFSGQAFTTQQPVVIRSPEDAIRFPKSQQLMQQIGVDSFCMLPLTTIVRRLGAIGFGSRRPCAFGDSELAFLGLVARQVAVAVDNVLHDESNQTATQELGQERAVGVADLLLKLLGGASLVVDEVGLGALGEVEVRLGLAALFVSLGARLFELGLNGRLTVGLGTDVSLRVALLFWIAHRHLRYRVPARAQA